MAGVRLVLLHPEVAGRSCGDCKQFLYHDGPNHLSGRKLLLPDGKPRPRLPNVPTPCWMCPKIPAGEAPFPHNAVEMSPKSWRAYTHYLECRAVLRFPDHDPIVRRNAMLIRMVEDEAQEYRADRRTDLTSALLLSNRFRGN